MAKFPIIQTGVVRNKLFIVTLLLATGLNAQFLKTEVSYQDGLFGHLSVAAGYGNDLILGNIALGSDFGMNSGEFMMIPKFTASANLYNDSFTMPFIRASVFYVTNFEDGAWLWSPEIGIAYFVMYVYYGYNFEITNDDFSTVGGHKVAIGINFLEAFF